MQLGGSCASDGGDHHSDRHHDDWDNTPHGVPHYAQVVKEGKGKLKWTADADGTFYVYDVDKEFIRFDGPVRRGDEIVVQPNDDKIYVAQRVVFNDNLRKDGKHQIWFIGERNRNDRDRDRDADRDKGQLPRGADRVVSGRGNLSIDSAHRAGTVYVYDEDDRRVVYSTRIDRGNSFQIFPGKDYVNLNSKRADNVRLREGHQFSLYISDR